MAAVAEKYLFYTLEWRIEMLKRMSLFCHIKSFFGELPNALQSVAYITTGSS